MGIPAAIGFAAAGLPPAGDQANAVLSGQITAIGPTAPFAFRGPMNLSLWASITTALTTTAGSFAATVGSASGLAAGDAINSVNLPRGATAAVLSGTNVTLAMSPRTYSGTIDSAGRITGNFPTDRILGASVKVASTAEGFTLPAGTTVTGIPQQNVAASLNSPGVPGIVQLSNPPSALPPLNTQIPFTFTWSANAVLISGSDNAASFTGAAIAWTGTVQLERSFDGGLTWLVCNIGGSGQLAQWTAGPITLTFGEPEKQVLYRLNCTALSSGNINYRISQTGGAAESLAIGPLSGG